ncbi:type VI secretion system Vgr family protein [Photobacterium sp. J15]|uniref:type VI secretion system Vgr family protein n=1 Tax=Photobacterium sp. J15 TaxID=265901 RepID=UPI0007E2EFFE|nr:type VI secretion system tip protein TssI/VgrG [Photobacterium sp. J15]
MANSKLLYQSRPLTVKLADNKSYVVTQLECKESISHGTHLSLSVASNDEIGDKVLGKVMNVTFEQATETRHFPGLVTSLELIGYSTEKELFFYSIQAADPLSLLAFRHNRQIFQKMTTRQIIEKLLGESDFKSHFKFSVSGNGSKHEYCVQLDETDLAFVQRLLASEGWHYHLDNKGSKPVIVIADSNQSFDAIKSSTIHYLDGSGDTARVVSEWTKKASIGTAKVSLADHTQALAEVFESGERKSAFNHSPTGLSAYHFGNGFEDKSEIRSAVKRQMEAMDVDKSTASSSSHIAALSSGKKFKLAKHPVSSFNQEYVVTQITHSIVCEESGKQVLYKNHFQCLPASSPYRPTPIIKPRVHSVHTATVTGPKGEEIYRDKLGRIKVQFHWDRLGKKDENTSCWLPVSQGLASKGFGIQFIPRVGDEVLVQYIDGDPDRPVVVGSIYNKANAAPYSAATQSGLKTRSTPKGSSKQGNELRFEDQKDKEQVFLHAEKDLVLDINNDCTATVKGKTLTKIEKTATLTAKEDIAISTEKTFKASSKENLSANSDKNLELEAGSDMALKAKSSVTVDGSKVSITGKSKIELKVGASKIEISASGIKIDAPQIAINGKGKAEMKAAMVSVEGQGKADLKGAMVTINGSAMTQVKAGAMVQIQGAIAKIN